jgi:hypothetical protein
VERCRKAQAAGHSVGLSAVTVSELEFGARHGERYDDEIAAVRKILTPFDIHDYDAVFSPVHYAAFGMNWRPAARSSVQWICSSPLMRSAWVPPS